MKSLHQLREVLLAHFPRGGVAAERLEQAVLLRRQIPLIREVHEQAGVFYARVMGFHKL